MTYKATIKMKSTVDGEEIYNEYRGEYTQKNGAHHFVYTDYSGNAVTKSAVEATNEQMLLHRVGAINGDMLFDKLTDTVTRYDAFVQIIGRISGGKIQPKKPEISISDFIQRHPLIREPNLPERWQSGDTSPAKCVSCNMCYRTSSHKCIFNMK